MTEIDDFMQQISAEMASEYKRIRRRAREDPGNAGHGGERNWQDLLTEWVPSGYHVVQGGRILGASGEASGQIDLLVLQPDYPKRLLDKELFLAAGVAAAFECKLTLKRKHLEKAAEQAVRIQRLVQQRSGTPYWELHSPLMYGILAHSHQWRPRGGYAASDEGRREQLESTFDMIDLLNAGLTKITRSCDVLDVVCVADLATVVPIRQIHPPDSVSVGFAKVQRDTDEPIAWLLTGLLDRLAAHND